MAGGQQPRDIGTHEDRATDDLDLLRRRLANVVGHALRTPAATIRGQAEILAVTEDPAERDAVIERLRHSARRLEEMIDETLLGEGIDTRLPTGRSEQLTLATEIRAVAAELDPPVEVELTGDDQAPVRAARDALHWLLRALLDNAARYGRHPVRCRIEASGDGVRLWIRSEGSAAGLTADDLRLAFEPFYRGERAVTVTATRLGLGLTVARRLASELGGRVHLEVEGDDVVALLELPSP